MKNSISQPWLAEPYLSQTRDLLNSYHSWTGSDLIAPEASIMETAKKLFHAPFVVVSHGAEEDPVFNYGNQMALDLWEMTWDSLVKTPSRLSAEQLERGERQRLLEEVTQRGYCSSYQGIRISSLGKRFKIEQAMVWNILNPEGKYSGQAASFKHWTYL